MALASRILGVGRKISNIRPICCSGPALEAPLHTGGAVTIWDFEDQEFAWNVDELCGIPS